jgi:hypothetical protein
MEAESASETLCFLTKSGTKENAQKYLSVQSHTFVTNI